MLLLECGAARERQQQADLVELIATGYAGCKSKDGAKALRAFVQALRQRE